VRFLKSLISQAGWKVNFVYPVAGAIKNSILFARKPAPGKTLQYLTDHIVYLRLAWRNTINGTSADNKNPIPVAVKTCGRGKFIKDTFWFNWMI